ncbi:MAG: hypothetical protein ACRDWE_09055, partial [Acidimicrobiales bacterium]
MALLRGDPGSSTLYVPGTYALLDLRDHASRREWSIVPDESGLPESVLAAAQLIVSEQSLDAILQQVVDLACGGVKGCAMAGITLLARSGPTTAVASNDVAGRVDATQYRVGSG